MPTSTIRRTVARNLPNGSRIVANVVLRGDDGTLSPGFSVTGELYEKHGTWSGAAQERNGREPDLCGCVHDEILRALPKLAPLVALHLSDLDGVPMHAEANALYYYRAARGLPGGWTDDYGYAERKGLTPAEYARRLACDILRVDEIPLDDVPADVLALAFHTFVDDQRARWADEAAHGRAMIEALPV